MAAETYCDILRIKEEIEGTVQVSPVCGSEEMFQRWLQTKKLNTIKRTGEFKKSYSITELTAESVSCPCQISLSHCGDAVINVRCHIKDCTRYLYYRVQYPKVEMIQI